ncbi:MAG: hypothetical protein SF069_04245 [Phycisphaerae bacterium]|nr:hypothetical protein [Phycisphaerae bacterium]
MKRILFTANLLAISAGALVGAANAGAPPTDHPFALVNVIDLFEAFDAPVIIDPANPNFEQFDPNAGPPGNYATYRANPRIGTNPSAVTVGDGKLWIGGFYNGSNFGGSTQASQASWYASLGVAEIDNIYTTSGFGGSLTVYNGSIHFGPTITNTDSITGMDYDPVSQIVYVAMDQVQDEFFPPTGADAEKRSYVGAIDADPISPTYGQFLWQRQDPINPPQSIFNIGDRFFGGVAVDPLNPRWVFVPQNGGGNTLNAGFRIFDTLNPSATPKSFNLKDVGSVCGSSFYRQIAFNAITGDMFLRNANAAEWIPRDSLNPSAPFECVARFIVQPPGGNGTANTTAAGDDVQLIAVGQPAGPDAQIIGGGPNEQIDTVPQGDDRLSSIASVRDRATGGNGLANTTAIGDDIQRIPVGQSAAGGLNIVDPGANGVIDSVIGNTSIVSQDDVLSPVRVLNRRPIGNVNLPNDDGDCDDAPSAGFGNGPFGQGQGIAIISASNLATLSEDLVLANNRRTFGANQVTDLRFFTLDGQQVARLELPCSPVASPTTGIAIYDIDYDEESGTLVVVEFEQRKAYVFRAQLALGPAVPRYDFTRNGVLNVADFAGFQQSFTGGEFAGPLSLNAQRVNTDSDCDVDFADYLVFQTQWDLVGDP